MGTAAVHAGLPRGICRGSAADRVPGVAGSARVPDHGRAKRGERFALAGARVAELVDGDPHQGQHAPEILIGRSVAGCGREGAIQVRGSYPERTRLVVIGWRLVEGTIGRPITNAVNDGAEVLPYWRAGLSADGEDEAIVVRVERRAAVSSVATQAVLLAELRDRLAELRLGGFLQAERTLRLDVGAASAEVRTQMSSTASPVSDRTDSTVASRGHPHGGSNSVSASMPTTSQAAVRT